MPQVDFTLADMRTVIYEEIEPIRRDLDLFQEAVANSFQELTDSMNEQFDEIRVELRQIRRVVRQHSADIAELRARGH